MKRSLLISKESLEKMHQHALQVFPEECCGFMFGEEIDGNKRKVLEVQAVRNTKVENRERRFEIDPLDYLKAERKAEKENKVLLGIYHSHPRHPAIPSEHDRVQAIHGFSYIILSSEVDHITNLTSWTLNDEHQFESESVLE